MKNTTKALAVIISAFLAAGALTSCSKTAKNTSTETSAETTEAVITDEGVLELLNSASEIPDIENAATITLSGNSASSSSEAVTVSGSEITVKSGGTYVVSGTLTDGRIIVDAQGEEVVLVLNNADITCSYSSPLYIYKSSQTAVYLQAGTENTLSDGESYNYSDSYSSEADEEPNACLYSKSDLVISGSGTLTVNANYNNGITGKDTLRIENCTLNVNAKNHGINGKDNLTVKTATVNVNANGDALRSTNDTDTTLGYIVIADSALNLTAGEDGIQAETYVKIGGGTANIKSGGGSSVTASDETSSKGIKAVSEIVIDGGTYNIDSSDDAIHSNGTVTVNSGDLTLTTGDDGIHGDSQVTVSGGNINITAHEGIEGTLVTINDGTINISASDDGINAAQKVTGVTPTVEINGGDITITMGQGDTDAIDANGNITVNGGTVNITAQSPFDYDGQGVINGGTVYVNGTQTTTLTNQFAGGMGGGMQGGFGGMQGEQGNPPAAPDGQNGQNTQNGQGGQRGGTPPQGGRGGFHG